MGFPVNNFTMISALAKGIKGIGTFDFMEDHFYESIDEELRGFNLIAMIVHDPEQHSGFHNFLEARFRDLHYSKGLHFLFFALVQPPREWWDNYERRGLRSFYNLWKANTGEVHSEINSIRQFNDSIADILGASNTKEPFVLLFRNFREKEALIFRTSEVILSKQFSILSDLSPHSATLTMDQISSSLPPGSKSVHKYYSPVIDQLDALVSVVTYGTKAYQPEKVRKHLTELSRSFLLEFQNQMVFVRKELADKAELDEDQLEIVYEVMSRLAHTMINLLGDKDAKPVSSLPDKLAGLFDDDSLRYLRTAFLLWTSLDRYSQHGTEEEFDYAPVAIGFARAFENEINHSFAHFVREELNINLPDYFYKHQPGVNALLELHDGSGRPPLNYNYKNYRNVVDGLDWSPLEIGTNLKALENITAKGNMGSDIHKALSLKFDEHELAILEREWKIIRNVRNNSAHPNQVSREDVVVLENAFTTLLNGGIFNILAKMKNEYRHGVR